MTVKIIYDEINQIGVPGAITIQGNTAFVYTVNGNAEKKNIEIGRNFGKVSVILV